MLKTAYACSISDSSSYVCSSDLLADAIVDEPVSRQQLRRHLAIVFDGYGVGKGIAVLFRLRLRGQIARRDADVDAVAVIVGHESARCCRQGRDRSLSCVLSVGRKGERRPPDQVVRDAGCHPPPPLRWRRRPAARKSGV